MTKLSKASSQSGHITLKSVAAHVGLTAGTVSLVLNQAPQSKSIPQRTKDRIFAAARELNYQPNPFARALRTNRGSAGSIVQDASTASFGLMFVGEENFSRAIHAIRAAGLSIPGDASVLGLDQSATVRNLAQSTP